MHNTSTVFPDDTDSRQFFSDVSLQHADIRNGYNELIKSQEYQRASQYLYDNVEVPNVNMDYNGSYLWNRLDNIIAALEDYAVNMDSTNARNYYSSEEPTETWDDMVWIA